MKRIGWVVLATAALGAAVPGAAFGSALGTARLTSGTDVLPGERTAVIRVTNTEAGSLIAPGRRINRVTLVLPASTAGVMNSTAPIIAPSGWTAQRTSLGMLQTVSFSSDPGLAPGASISLLVPVAVQRPPLGDRSGQWRVNLSGDDGATYREATPAGGDSLSTTVRALEIVGAPRVAAPALAADGTATEGQMVTYVYEVKNHSLSELTVTSGLTAGSALDAVDPPSTLPVPAGATVSLESGVALGVTGADRTASFTALAESATGPSSATRLSSSLLVQRAVGFDSFAVTPDAVAAGSTVAFAVGLRKTGTPGGNVSGATLSFGDAEAALASNTALATGISHTTLHFAPTTVSALEGGRAVALTIVGSDANGADFRLRFKGLGPVVVDSTPPELDISLAGPPGQVAVKDGDELRVTLKVDDATEDPRAARVSLRQSDGPDIPVALARVARDGGSVYTGVVRPSFASTSTTVRAAAAVADRAGNLAEAESATLPVDNVRPVLGSPATMPDGTSVRVQFNDESGGRGGCDPLAYRISGVPGRVTAVGDADGGACDDTRLDSGVRILRLAIPVLEEQPTLTYDPAAASSPARDGAGNRALAATVRLLHVIAAPAIVSVTRNAGTETAYRDPAAGTYHTRFSNPPSNTEPDLEVRVGGARNGDQLQVLDEAGNVLFLRTLSGGSGEFEATIGVPLGSLDDTYVRRLRFVREGEVGPQTDLRVVLDRVAPSIESSVLAISGEIEVRFDEPIVAGTDFAHDWFVREGDEFLQAQSVAVVDERTRRLRYASAGGPFREAVYVFRSSNGRRYEDRAGNVLFDSALTE